MPDPGPRATSDRTPWRPSVSCCIASRSALRTTLGLLSTLLKKTGRKKRAMTVRADINTIVQGPVPGHSGADHPANTTPGSGAAMSVTTDRPSNAAAHDDPQLMAAGLELTKPWPLPETITESVYL